MEPRIQYAQTEDGVSIAYWTHGEGEPFIQMPSTAFNPTYRAWQSPEGRHWFESLAEKRKVIRYDSRGFGQSQHDVTTSSLDTMVLDLAAIIDHLGLEKVALFGYLHSGPVAIAYAVRHPERVSHLILWCSSARGIGFFESDRGDALAQLRAADWEFYTETLAFAVFGWAGAEQARRYAAVLRETATPDAVQAAMDAILGIDVTDLLPQVSSPTLVLHRSEYDQPDVDTARRLAAQIPNAQLTVLDGESPVPYLGDAEAVLQTIDEFLSEGEEPAAEPPATGDVHTILFTDMESSTSLTQQLGDAGAQELVRAHNSIVRDALKAHAGSEIKHTGDGIMASFPSASGALECAVAIQRAVAAREADTPLHVRIGLNAGEPVAEEHDLFGTAVQLARRICDQAKADEIMASDVVRQLVAGKGFLFADQGETALRGFEDPVRLYEVRWEAEA